MKNLEKNHSKNVRKPTVLNSANYKFVVIVSKSVGD